MTDKTCELLSPAKDLESAIAAVNCGADAVYVGAPVFSARAQAGNSPQDIEKIIRYARPYRVKTYVALNTILQDDELEEALRLVRMFHDMGADGIIIQDMGLLEMDLPPIPLIASTQCHNDSWEKVKFLEDTGFRRAILARELAVEQIGEIRSKTGIELEVFVHGALCVSYSGRCYFSYANGGRSGNRGVCAQPCRQTYSLLDSEGKVISKPAHLLSLKDLDLSGHLKELLDIGVSSFKIEGRLKDINYIRNVVSYYRKELDKAMAGTGLRKSSSGKSIVPFEANPQKSFNRGFTAYFLHGRKDPIASMRTQKSVGEPIGTVKAVFADHFTLDVPKGKNPLHNGDGICFFGPDGVLGGMFVNRVENEKIYPQDIRYIFKDAFIFRNQDHEFEKLLNNAKIERKMQVKAGFYEDREGFILNLTDEDGCKAEAKTRISKVTADKPEMAMENIRKQLVKTGGSVFTVSELDVRLRTPYFIPVKDLNELRRTAVEKLTAERIRNTLPERIPIRKNSVPYPEKTLTYEGNVLNKKAEAFYFRHGVVSIEPAAESGLDMTGKNLMTTRHCLKYEFGLCARDGKGNPNPGRFKEPLCLDDGKRKYRLEFDCADCRMKIRNE